MEVKLGTQCSHGDHEKNASGTFPYNCFSLLKLANHTGEICTRVYLSVSIISTSSGIFIGACPQLNYLH